MLKKTTIYIEEKELKALKILSIARNKSVAELVRAGVNKVCKSLSSEERKIMDLLYDVRKNAKKRGYTTNKIMNLAIKAQKEVRRERKQKSNRS